MVVFFANVSKHNIVTRRSSVVSRSSQCSTTGVTKAVVCDIPSVGWCI